MTTRGNSSSSSSNSNPVDTNKKSFQRKLFETAEENLSNNQSTDEFHLTKNQPSEHQTRTFINYETFFNFYGLYVRKEYRECLHFVEKHAKSKALLNSPL